MGGGVRRGGGEEKRKKHFSHLCAYSYSISNWWGETTIGKFELMSTVL